MGKFSEVKETVKEKGHGFSEYNRINGDPVYLSRGVREYFFGDENREQEIVGMVTRFQKKDYGDAAEHGKTSRPGHEYGRYEVTALTSEDGEDTAVWLHRAEDSIMVYFKFERSGD